MAPLPKVGTKVFASHGSVMNGLVDSLKAKYPNLEFFGPKAWGTPAQCRALGIDPTGAPRVEIDELNRVVAKFSENIPKNAGITVFCMPKNLTIVKLIRFASSRGVPMELIWPDILREVGDIPIEKTYLVVMTTGLINDSTGKDLSKQQALCHSVGGEIPRLIDVLAQSILKYKSAREEVPVHDLNIVYSRTANSIQNWPIVAGFPKSLRVHRCDPSGYTNIGVVAFKMI